MEYKEKTVVLASAILIHERKFIIEGKILGLVRKKIKSSEGKTNLSEIGFIFMVECHKRNISTGAGLCSL